MPIWDSTAMARTEELARLFQQPNSPAQRRYEICRAYFYCNGFLRGFGASYWGCKTWRKSILVL